MSYLSLATRLGAVALAGLLCLDATAAMARTYRQMTCAELWYERNAIYADEGYCFETARAIRVFGEACFPPYGELTRSEQRQVDLIRDWENRRGCN